MSIVTQNRDFKIIKLLAVLENSDFDFYPTGSRFFGGAREDSDWDFYVENSKDPVRSLMLISFLTDHGFEPFTTTEEYYDLTIDVVMRHKAGIDVQILNDFETKHSLHIFIGGVIGRWIGIDTGRVKMENEAINMKRKLEKKI